MALASCVVRSGGIAAIWSGTGPSGSLAMVGASERTGTAKVWRLRSGGLVRQPCQAALAFATWVAIASISAGDRQS